jgi:hypothetical protein
MNYYAQGGQAHGIKSLAQDLAQYGRGGDTMVAHINPQEAEMLKAMGGSGTINPTTGLPEFLKIGGVSIGNPIKAVQQGFAAINPLNPGSSISKTISGTPIIGPVNDAINKVGTQIFQPLEKAVVQPVSSGLAQFDKAVGNTIPGGWGTAAQVAANFIPVIGPALSVGIGALNGSGVTHKGGKFNLQGAVMGGARAYAMSELADYAAGASDSAVKSIEKVAEEGLTNAATQTPFQAAQSNIDPSFLEGMSADQVINSAPQTPFQAAQSNIDPSFLERMTPEQVMPPAEGMQTPFQAAQSNIDQSMLNNMSAEDVANAKVLNTPTPEPSYVDKYINNVKDTGSGIKNLMGAGDVSRQTASELAAASAKAANTMAPMTAAGITAYTTMGLQALDEQRKYLQEQASAGAISNQQYNDELAKINAQADEARQTVAANPLQVNPGIEGLSEGPSLYERKNSNESLYERNPYEGATLYAMGGSVNPPDDQTGIPNRSPMQNFDQGGLMSMVNRTVPQQTFAAGGMPRFLSGGGDGMSDSIKASINGNQEARLADGEFVVPADVVSHIGNGSSKAGAKQLYSMMDRVRQARVGTKKQGKQINPRKYLAA